MDVTANADALRRECPKAPVAEGRHGGAVGSVELEVPRGLSAGPRAAVQAHPELKGLRQIDHLLQSTGD